MNVTKIRIVSKGEGQSTRVYSVDEKTGNEIELKNVTRIEIAPLEPRGFFSAKVEFFNVELDVVAKVEDRKVS